MSKIDLDPITSGYNLSKINANFQKVEDELNNKVLYRSSPAGEPNSMSSNLDMNGLSILNASKISSNVLELGGVQVVPTNLAVDPYNGTREALRRSYAEAGYNLVSGSFEVGGVLINANDVLLQESTGKAFSGPAGTVVAGTNPIGGGFVDKSGALDAMATVAFVASGVFGVGSAVRVSDRGGAKFVVVSGGTPDGLSILDAGNGNTAVLTPKVFGVSPEYLGATRSKTDQSAALIATFQFAAANGIPVVGHGVYWTAASVPVIASVSSFATMDIRPLAEIRTGIPSGQLVNVLPVTAPSLRLFGLRSQNSDSVADTAGIHVLANTTKMWSCQAVQHKYNLLIASYSCSANHCQGVLGGTGLSVYGQSFSNECNACEIVGGEYYGNTDWAMYVGDSRLSSSIPSNEFFGNKIDIRGPTCDQGKVKIDRVLNVYCDVYCEQGGSSHLAAIELGGSFANSLRGIEIANGFYADYKYAAKCLGSVSGLSFHNNYLRGAFTSALYMTSDQYAYSYYDNTTTAASFAGPEVHTGVRFGQTGNVFADKMIDSFDLTNGLQKTFGEHIYPNKSVYEAGIRYDYPTQRYRYYKTAAAGHPGVASGTTFTFSVPADALKYNGGDAITFSGGGGALSYVVSVNYEAGTLTYDSGTWAGGGTISKPSATPRAEFTSFQLPTLTGVSDGSVAWNTFTVNATPNYWIKKPAGWTAG